MFLATDNRYPDRSRQVADNPPLAIHARTAVSIATAIVAEAVGSEWEIRIPPACTPA